MKYLQVTMPDRTVWRIPAEFIAAVRAKYYAQLDVDRGDVDDYEEAYQKELAFALNDKSELLDWAANNMDWADVAEHAELIYNPTPDPNAYRRAWTNADKEIVEA